jgi:site-specific recombinase XerD
MNRVQTDHDQILKLYKKKCDEQRMPINSVISRVSAIKKFLKFMVLKDRLIDMVDAVDIQNFLEYEIEQETSLSTISNYYAYLKHFFSYCKENNYNDDLDWTRVNFEAVIDRTFETLNDNEVEEMFSIINKQKNPITKLRDEIIFNILFFTGCTLKELHSLVVFSSREQKDDAIGESIYYILLKEKEIFLGGQFNRVLPLPVTIVDKIKEYRELIMIKFQFKKIKEGYSLFIATRGHKIGESQPYHPLTYNQIQSRMFDIKQKSSFINRKISIKNIRHTVITKMLEDDYRLDHISQIVGLDIASIKFYIKDYSKYEDEIKNLLRHKHPFRDLFE